MHKFFKVILTLCITSSLLFIGQTTSLAYEPYEISKYHSDIVVNEDGTINITEEVSVRFNELRRGIYFQIASSYNMDFDGERRQYNFPITNVEIKSDHSASIDYKREGVVIRLGDEDYYANDYETYIISYTMHTKDLGLEGYTMLFHNIIYQWDTTIDKTSFSLKLPSNFIYDNLSFDIGSSDSNLNYLDYSINENTINGTYNNQLEPYESITVLLKLPEDYFSYPSYDLYYWILVGVASLALVISFLIFLKKGKDAPLIITAEFMAPSGVSSAECGYIIDGQVDNRDILSLLIEWGKDGFIKISDNDKNDLLFIKLKELPTSYPAYQKNLFTSLFKSGDEVKVSSLKQKFNTTIDVAKTGLDAYMHLPKNRIYSGESVQFRILVALLGIFPITIFVGMCTWFNNFSLSSLLFVVIAHIASLVIIYLVLFNDEKTRSTSKSSFINMILYGLLFAFFIGLSWFTIRDAMVLIPWIILIIYTIIMAFISQRMIKRTDRGHKLYGQVVGLYRFIQYAEKDRLDALSKENPYIFYHILPYAFAFGLSDVWSEHFKDLVIPEVDWYSYNNMPLTNYYMMRSLTNSMMYAQRELVSLPPMEARSGSSNGGFGSGGGFGGGGFSGGGFGGSSGGSW